jgi:two-component system CheB/CheR fusion protein
VTDLNYVVREAIEVVRGQMEARDIQLTSELTSEPFSVDGDSARLQQVLVNLLNNAAKYTPRGGHVVVRTKREDAAAMISVRDDGAGIPADMLESVFDLFVQSSRTLDRAAGGLGVGLSLVRSLVDMHGGSVSAHSDGEGKGSEFVVRLPLAAVSHDRPDPGESLDEIDTSRTCVVPRGANVMIVEDNADSREMLCELLELQGFKCHPAENGAAALALLKHLRPDVAILDVGLPEIDGFELARRIRARPELVHTCLIALTGYGQPSDRAVGREAGFDAHLVKPVRVEQLLELLAEMQPNVGREPARPAARSA